MNNPFTREEMLDFVRQEVAEAMGLALSAVAADAAIADDLDADSLDFVDIVHRLEKGLGVTLPKKTLLEHAAEHLGSRDPILDRHGLTPLGVALLRHGFNEFSGAQAVVGARLNDISNGATVGNWASLCYRLFDYLPEACPECRGSEAVRTDAGKVVCGRCSAPLRPQSGDLSVRSALPQLLAAAQGEHSTVEAA